MLLSCSFSVWTSSAAKTTGAETKDSKKRNPKIPAKNLTFNSLFCFNFTSFLNVDLCPRPFEIGAWFGAFKTNQQHIVHALYPQFLIARAMIVPNEKKAKYKKLIS